MDNAQLTSQIAQINTVTGIATLNTSVQGLSSQFLQMQTLQGASLVGKSVIVPGSKIDIASGVGQGGFELATPADAVKVEVLSPAGQVIDTLNMGAQSAGVHGFDWASGNYDNTSNLSFRVTASSGATPLAATALMRDTVNAVSASGTSLQLELARNGTVDYSTVKAIN
jgi:flagellar basal-body rod modification protein FlgD